MRHGRIVVRENVYEVVMLYEDVVRFIIPADTWDETQRILKEWEDGAYDLEPEALAAAE